MDSWSFGYGDKHVSIWSVLANKKVAGSQRGQKLGRRGGIFE